MKAPFSLTTLTLNIIIFIWNVLFCTMNFYAYAYLGDEYISKLILGVIHLIAAGVTYYFILHKQFRYLVIKYLI